jgi:hypothetical protein
MFTQKKNNSVGVTSQLADFQVASNDFCSSFWNAAISYPSFNLSSDYLQLLRGGQSTNMKPCVVLSFSAQSRM